jgi:F-type H+-transporting ATPase subunit b
VAAFFIFFAGVAVSHAGSSSSATTSSSAGHSQEEYGSEHGEHNEFRHSTAVQWIARTLHLPLETTAQIFEDANAVILWGLILFVIMKFLPKAMRNRTAVLQKQLVEARTATEMANERLSAVEAKLARLGEDIEAIRQQTERDALEDEKRIKRSLEEERVRIVKSAEQEIESAGAAAQRQLKRFAAELAIDRAAARIQLSADADKAIIQRFGRDIARQFGKGGRN